MSFQKNLHPTAGKPSPMCGWQSVGYHQGCRGQEAAVPVFFLLERWCAVRGHLMVRRGLPWRHALAQETQQHKHSMRNLWSMQMQHMRHPWNLHYISINVNKLQWFQGSVFKLTGLQLQGRLGRAIYAICFYGREISLDWWHACLNKLEHASHAKHAIYGILFSKNDRIYFSASNSHNYYL